MYAPSVLRYDLMKDFKPVAQLVSYPLALVVNGGVPARNLAEFAAWLKANPNQRVFGTPAPGGQVQFVGWVVGQALGAPLTPVPYKGTAAQSKTLKPSMGLVRDFAPRWPCSTILFKHRDDRSRESFQRGLSRGSSRTARCERRKRPG